jgi:hypothetical protein
MFYRVLLIFLILPVLLSGCRKAPDNRDPFKATDATVVTTVQTEEIAKSNTVIQAVDAKDIGDDVLLLQKDLEDFSEDIERFENFGVESAVAEIDRELDGF